MKNIFLLFAALFACVSAWAQTTVTGVVTSAADNEPLIGATVLVKGTAKGASTDIDGNYSIQAETGQTLVVSYVGMETQEVKVTGSVVNVVLKENSNVLDEVVVVGYGQVKRSDLTSSISTVKGEDITEMTTGNAMDALQGKVNGVQIASGGGPGVQPKVIIRGVTTVNGSSPLYVVDGMPVGTEINFLNPNDIESMEVLKDASAAAIYGTRGSNGVILITTKKGAAGKINVNFSANIGFETLKKPDMAGADEYKQVFFARYTNDGRVAPWNTPEGQNVETDWWDTVINKTALVQNYQLGISGGNDKYTFAASVGYFRNNSQYDVGYWDKLTINLNTEYKFSKYVQAGLQIAPRTESWEDTPNLFGSAMGMDPTTPVFKNPGNFTDNHYNDYQRSYNNQVWNPAASLARPAGKSRNYGVLLNPYLQIVPIKGLTIRTQFGLNGVVTRKDSYSPVFSLDALEQTTVSSASRRMYENVDWNWTNTINYMTTIAEKHNINVMAGFTAERFGYWNVEARREDIPSDEETLREVNAGTGEQYGYGDTSYNSLVSYLGRVMYNYNQRYYITASVRVDGSSRFSEGNKYATFPAVSGAWRISEEEFMKDISWLDNLKIRAGWGKVGNQNITNSAYQSLVGSNNIVLGGVRVPGTTIGSIGNPNLKWETVEDYNVGIDAMLFNSRLSLTADFYKKKSHDMLYKKQNYMWMGYPAWLSEVTMNIGEMEATGWELGISWRDRVGDWRYEVGVTQQGHQAHRRRPHLRRLHPLGGRRTHRPLLRLQDRRPVPELERGLRPLRRTRQPHPAQRTARRHPFPRPQRQRLDRRRRPRLHRQPLPRRDDGSQPVARMEELGPHRQLLRNIRQRHLQLHPQPLQRCGRRKRIRRNIRQMLARRRHLQRISAPELQRLQPQLFAQERLVCRRRQLLPLQAPPGRIYLPQKARGRNHTATERFRTESLHYHFLLRNGPRAPLARRRRAQHRYRQHRIPQPAHVPLRC